MSIADMDIMDWMRSQQPGYRPALPVGATVTWVIVRDNVVTNLIVRA